MEKVKQNGFRLIQIKGITPRHLGRVSDFADSLGVKIVPFPIDNPASDRDVLRAALLDALAVLREDARVRDFSKAFEFLRQRLTTASGTYDTQLSIAFISAESAIDHRVGPPYTLSQGSRSFGAPTLVRDSEANG